VADARGPTIRRRRLAAELRRLRTIAELTLDQAANRLGDGWSCSKLSRVETARLGISAEDLATLLDLYGVSEPKREPLLRLARNARVRGWWDAYARDLPGDYVSYIELEAEAVAIRCFDAGMINGLMQTEEYAREVTAAALMGLASPAQAGRRVDVRLIRQRVLSRQADPLRLTAVIAEAALRRPAGPHAAMRAQYGHLLSLASLPNVALQVLPTATGAHPAMTGSFEILEFAGPHDQAVVYVETMTGNLFVESDSDVYRYSLAFDHLRAMALGPAESTAYLGQLAGRTIRGPSTMKEVR
jgi:transcriptional regulator with XRE-family HTH domain